MMEGP